MWSFSDFCCSYFPFLLVISFFHVRMTVAIVFPLGNCKSAHIFGSESYT
jgi:hypothetical protein